MSYVHIDQKGGIGGRNRERGNIRMGQFDRQIDLPEERVLEGLNPEQIEVVTHDQGPLLILAGAGTGKTKVITHRIAHLIATKRARPEEVLALTFTDKAAAEMEERVDLLLPYGFANVWISTFHAFGDRVLREYGLELGLTPDIQVLSRPEQAIFFREHLFEFPLSYYRPLSNPTRFIDAMITLISRAKDEDVSPEEYLAYAHGLQKKSEADPSNGELAELAAQQLEVALTYQRYQKLLATEGKADFGDQVALVLKLFREHPLILKRLQERFKYILIDEFQDTNYAQFQLVKLLAGTHNNITVVGDDDQSIYKFRGAAISNILNFMDIYPQAKLVVLTRNYRSSQVILDAAYRLITHNNPDRLEVKNNIDKRLRAVVLEGEPVRHIHCDTISSESDQVARLIEEKVESGEHTYRDFAILVRSNANADPFLKALNLRSIPYRFSGSRGLYSREEVRLLISFLRAISDFNDSISLYHLASSEIYQLDMRDLTRCMNLAKRRNFTLHYVFEHLAEFQELGGLSLESRATIAKLVSDIEKYVNLSRDNPTGVVLYRFLTDSGYLSRLIQAGTLRAEEKVQNIAKFFEAVSNFSHLTANDRVFRFVSHLDLLIEAGDDPATAEADLDVDAVNVLTVHKAKGLEFPVVFLVSSVNNKFPLPRRSEPIGLPEPLIKDILPSGDFHLQEERRLFYVAMTRAQRELYLTSARDYGSLRPRKVSQFVLEALDKPRADERYLKSSALEAIHRNAPSPEGLLEPEGIIPEDEVINLSHLQVDDYLTCPLKYKYVHVLRVPILPHHTVVYGRALHEAVKEYHRRKVNRHPVTVEDLIAIFERAWISEGFLTREHEEQRLETGRKALCRFFEDQEGSGLVPTHIEQDFSFLLGSNRMVGRWDRVDIRDGKVYIVDFKSSEVRQQKEADRRAKESLQLAIYALAYHEIHGRTPDRVELHFLESGLVGTAGVSEEDFERTVEKINRAAAGIRARDYAAKPGYMACQFCAYSGVCPSTASG